MGGLTSTMQDLQLNKFRLASLTVNRNDRHQKIFRDCFLTVTTSDENAFYYDGVEVRIAEHRRVVLSYWEHGTRILYLGSIGVDGIIRLVRSDGSMGTFSIVENGRWVGTWCEKDNFSGAWELILEDIEVMEANG